MSDFGSDPSLPPPPPGAGAPPPPFGSYGAPPPGPQGYPPQGQPPQAYPQQGYPQGYPQPGYGPQGYPPAGYQPMMGVPQKPPRPAVPVGSMLLILGGAILIIGSFLNWFTVFGEEVNGFTDVGQETKDGPAYVFFGVLSIGFGIAQLAARKVLAVAILAVVFGSFAVLGALVDVSDLQDVKDQAGSSGVFEAGPGLYVVLIGSLIALAGAIATLAKRRAWPAHA